MELTHEQLNDLVKHMFNCAANIVATAETALPQVDHAHYSKGTKQDIKRHLSQDIVRTLGIMYPAMDYMKAHMPEFTDTLDRWKQLYEEIGEKVAQS